ncbi:hypothetical protein BpHYR1_014029 [Brachionus plicatilis]|uniref:Uncharacterized protein n=1 Tax=Brachionus plicatilis TaxID=10195 RepID=A0A3M7QSD8_BRAPC|nr:hypothetical protein BpHYR1_014029 [Brachionus plicatilis]
MENDPKTVSNESVLMNPDDDTLVDAENLVVLKQSDTKKRRANIEYEFFCSYDNYNEFVEKIVRGEVKGKNLQFKHQNGEKYSFYCRYLSKGCITEFCKEPNISKSQMLHPYDWNKRSKPIHHIKDNIYMCKGGKDGSSTSQECKQFLTDLDAVPWLQFDQMISSIFNIRIITFNKDNWKLSK